MDILLFNQEYDSLGELGLTAQKDLLWKLNERGKRGVYPHRARLKELLSTYHDPLNAISEWVNRLDLFFLPVKPETRADWERLLKLELHPEERFIVFSSLSSEPMRQRAWREALDQIEAKKASRKE